jgi:hypothetical protein
MYTKYVTYVNELLESDKFNFKNNVEYNNVLENVTYPLGKSFLDTIVKVLSEDFTEITLDDVNNYLLKNDKRGSPKKEIYRHNNKVIICSPTSLRYALHALLVIKYLKTKPNKNIVEVGCGYGGLFLAINHFSKLLNIEIDNYYMIDLPEICNLIKKYLGLHDIHLNYCIHPSTNYGSDINMNNMFLISNYCFTVIEETHRKKYVEHLFPKIVNGFMVWQTCFNLPIYSTYSILNKEHVNSYEEYPQTSPGPKNYYVYF